MKRPQVRPHPRPLQIEEFPMTPIFSPLYPPPQSPSRCCSPAGQHTATATPESPCCSSRPQPPSSSSSRTFTTGIPELDNPPADWMAWNARMNAAVEEQELQAAGEWPQGTRDLYATPFTAWYNQALAQALTH